MKNIKILIGVFTIFTIGLFVSISYYGYQNFAFIKDTGGGFYTWLNAQSPFLAGAIGLWVMGVFTFIIRYLPSRSWQFIIKQITVTLTINNHMDSYRQFFEWYNKTGNSSHSRTLSVVESPFMTDSGAGWYKKVKISAGYGVHFFFFKGRIFKISITEKEAQNLKETKETIIIQTIGRSHKPFQLLLNAIEPPPIKNKTLTILYKWMHLEWRQYDNQTVRKFDSVIIPQYTREKLTQHLEEFLSEKKWYLNHGIPYRTGIMLYGPPGTGKTSLIKGLCEYFDKPLYMLNLNMLTDDELTAAFASLPPNSIILVEDIDTYSVTSSRQEKGNENSLLGITLSGLLNAIDGIISSDGRILIATTNHIEKLDAALIRKGRFNLSIELTYLTQECIFIFFEKFFPEFNVPEDVVFKQNISPAALQSKILDNRKHPEKVFDFCIETVEELVSLVK